MTTSEIRKSYPINAFIDWVDNSRRVAKLDRDITVYYGRADVLHLFEYFISVLFSDYEAEVFHLYYRDNVSIKAICKRFDLTSNSFKNLKERLLSKLDNCPFVYIITLGFDSYEKMLTEKGKKQGFDEGYKEGYAEGAKIGYNQIEKAKEFSVRQGDSNLKDIKELPHILLEDLATLEDLPLSIRAYNCLHNYGLRTLRDVAALPPNELIRIRNMGTSTFTNVVDVLVSFGVDKEPYSKWLCSNNKE
jgi:hypothetical protein